MYFRILFYLTYFACSHTVFANSDFDKKCILTYYKKFANVDIENHKSWIEITSYKNKVERNEIIADVNYQVALASMYHEAFYEAVDKNFDSIDFSGPMNIWGQQFIIQHCNPDPPEQNKKHNCKYEWRFKKFGRINSSGKVANSIDLANRLKKENQKLYPKNIGRLITKEDYHKFKNSPTHKRAMRLVAKDIHALQCKNK